MGKVFERLIKRRLQPCLTNINYASRWQFGFRKGRSAEDAIYYIRQQVDRDAHKYVIGILFDATAAFDNLWWPSIFTEIDRRCCPLDLARLLASYLEHRDVSIQGTYNTSTRRITKGCPQGSILGPDLWNLVMDSLLRTLDQSGATYAAYADDLLILVSGNSRREVEQHAQRLTNMVTAWTEEHHLTISASKTVIGVLKGNFRGRPPTVKLGQVNLQQPETFKYLGVTFGSRLAVSSQLEALQDKTLVTLTALTNLAHSVWGLRFPQLKTY